MLADWLRMEILGPYSIKANTVAEHFGVSRLNRSVLFGTDAPTCLPTWPFGLRLEYAPIP